MSSHDLLVFNASQGSIELEAKSSIPICVMDSFMCVQDKSLESILFLWPAAA